MSVLRKHSHQMNIRMRSIRSTMATDRPSLRRMKNSYVTAQITTPYSANRFNPFVAKGKRKRLASVYSQSTSEGHTGTECDMSSSSDSEKEDSTFVTDATCAGMKNTPSTERVIPIFRTGLIAYAGGKDVTTAVASETPALDGRCLVDDDDASTDDENDEDSESNVEGKTDHPQQGNLSRDSEGSFSGRRVRSVDGSFVTNCLLAPRNSCMSDDMVMRKSSSVFTLPRRSDPGPLSPPPGSKHTKLAYGEYLKSERYTYLERMRLNKQIKAAKTLGVIMGCLLVCWLPYSIMWPLQAFCNNCIHKRIYDIAIWINYFNSSVNPIIYCMCNQSFRRAYTRLFSNR
ncbi:tyramine receptor tyra-2-like [Lineus longissimus]|uniref:tyramine receptor tyra-2-like n=1 Tax=Lineus longissimus TaxID=88925 RepID=UPI00315D8EA7